MESLKRVLSLLMSHIESENKRLFDTAGTDQIAIEAQLTGK